jgi:hypothetical protein
MQSVMKSTVYRANPAIHAVLVPANANELALAFQPRVFPWILSMVAPDNLTALPALFIHPRHTKERWPQ